MRSLALYVGLDVSMAGLLVAAYQAILRVWDGYWTPVPLRDLWFALGGAQPYFPGLPAFDHLAAWVLDQPLWSVLPFIGGFIAWLGSEGMARACE